MYDVVYIFRGILIGLMVSVPLGPMGVLIIQKTLQKGALAGFVAGMGAACADLFYATVAAFGSFKMMEKRSGSFFPFMREKQNGRRVFQVEYSSICPSARSSSE